MEIYNVETKKIISSSHLCTPKLLVAGSRSLQCETFIHNVISASLPEFMFPYTKPQELVSGACKKGPDLFGETFALANEIKIITFPAEWGVYGRSAGPKRNKKMAQYIGPGGYAMIFWDGESTGSKNMFDECLAHDINTLLFTVTPETCSD